MGTSVKVGIDAEDKTVRQVLDKVKYVVDYFQREYRWERKHVEQLIDDLTIKFLSNYNETHERKDVQNYDRYFLGPIVLSEKYGGNSIIDGQQRLTTITLLLIYLNHLQKNREDKVNISDLIFSEKYGEKSFNIQVPERKECMEKLYNGEECNNIDYDESIKNLVERYHDIEEIFPEELKGKALPYFIDWLIDNVVFVEIKTYSDDDAYTIFETMNDRGLNLTPTEMLKGYIISQLRDEEDKKKVNDLWRNIIFDLKKIDKDEDMEFFKAWLRAKYAETIRVGKKGAPNEDFEKIGTRFHQWVRDNKDKIDLKTSKYFYNFVDKNMRFYAGVYMRINEATENLVPELEHIYYVDQLNLARSLYYPLLLAPIKTYDDENTIKKKLSLVAAYLEMFVIFRVINYRSYAHSTIRYTMYSLVKEIRDKSVYELVNILKRKVDDITEKFGRFDDFGMHSQNKRKVKFLLARITAYLEKHVEGDNRFEKYLSQDCQIEHIWADKFEEHLDEFTQRDEFEIWRNKIGALLLLCGKVNQSYQDLPYEEKVKHYVTHNILAKSLHPEAYNKNPDFINFIKKKKLPFKPHLQFKKADIESRQRLYKEILKEIYNKEIFDEIVSD